MNNHAIQDRKCEIQNNRGTFHKLSLTLWKEQFRQCRHFQPGHPACSELDVLYIRNKYLVFISCSKFSKNKHQQQKKTQRLNGYYSRVAPREAPWKFSRNKTNMLLKYEAILLSFSFYALLSVQFLNVKLSSFFS